MVQLEVGERLAAGPGTKAYGIPSVRRAWWADATVVGKVPPTVFVPPPRVDSALVDIRRHPPAGRRRPTPGRVRPRRGRVRAAPQDAPPLARRPRHRRRPRPRPASAPRPGPRSSSSPTGSAWPTTSPNVWTLGRMRADVTDLGSPPWLRSCSRPPSSPASLRVTGVRRRRLPPDRRRDGEPRPRRHAHLRRRRRAGACAAPVPTVPADDDNLVAPGPACGRAARPTSPSTSASPPAPGSAAGRPTPPRCCGGPASTTSTSPCALGADVPFCLVGGRARVTGIGEVVEPLPSSRCTFTLLTPPVHCSTPAVYRAWDDLGGPTRRRPERPRARRPRGGAGAGRVARPPRRRSPARRRCSPAAAAPGSSRAPTTGDDLVVVHTVDALSR